jgi:flagellar biosynthesis/type III secretory pathway protein FliH
MDVNDAFDQILLSEERIAEESYKQGFEKGVSEGNLEAYHLGKLKKNKKAFNVGTFKPHFLKNNFLGFHRGAEIGSELGFYLGVLENHQIPPPINEKISHLITQLRQIIEQFPKVNCDSIDLFESLNTIRAQFKKLTSLLKINVSYPDKSKLSF